ncbi:MAG: hypothetical protein AAF561_13010, partial [Planctomycetota bacterium]
AAASCTIGNGHVVVSGVHPEVTGDDFASLKDAPATTVDLLREHEVQRASVFNAFWTRLIDG